MRICISEFSCAIRCSKRRKGKERAGLWKGKGDALKKPVHMRAAVYKRKIKPSRWLLAEDCVQNSDVLKIRRVGARSSSGWSLLPCPSVTCCIRSLWPKYRNSSHTLPLHETFLRHISSRGWVLKMAPYVLVLLRVNSFHPKVKFHRHTRAGCVHPLRCAGESSSSNERRSVTQLPYEGVA